MNFRTLFLLLFMNGAVFGVEELKHNEKITQSWLQKNYFVKPPEKHHILRNEVKKIGPAVFFVGLVSAGSFLTAYLIHRHPRRDDSKK